MAASTPPAPPRITGFGYVRPLGTGGFADVYQYEQDMPRRVVAVKVLKAPLSGSRDRSDFEAEADAMARLSSHPSIVSIYSAGVAADGRPYIAMEFCPDSLRSMTRGKPLALDVVLDAGVRLAGALETAHRAGILHRDIKPSNVLLTSLGRPALTDFGISMLAGRGEVEGEKSQALSVPWAAPEVVLHQTSGTIASEVWSLGATLYTLAAGISPFEHPDRSQNTLAKMVTRISQANYRPISGAQGYEPFEEVLRQSMMLDPEERFVSMREFGEALRSLQRSYGYDATPLETVGAHLVTPAAAPDQVRGPVVSRVRESSRSQRRAELRAATAVSEDSDGVIVSAPPTSNLAAGLIGAGVAIGGVALLLGIALALGWIG